MSTYSLLALFALIGSLPNAPSPKAHSASEVLGSRAVVDTSDPDSTLGSSQRRPLPATGFPSPQGPPGSESDGDPVDQEPLPPAGGDPPNLPGEPGDPVPEFGEALWHHLPPTPFETLRGKTVLVDVFRTW